jgi:hypothetical protein
VAQLQVAAHAAAANVEVAVLHAQLVTPVGVLLNGEGRVCAGLSTTISDTTISMSPVGILGFLLLRSATVPFTCSTYSRPSPRACSHNAAFGFHIKGQLGEAVTVAQVDEGHAAQVARALHPARKHHFFSNVFKAQLAAGMCSKHYLWFFVQDAKVINEK